MFSHGVIAGLLFAIVGRIVYERTHTRQLAELEKMHLGKRMPFAAWAFVIAGMASMGLPGFSGFVAELQVLVGSWIAKPWWTAAAGVGIIIGVAYTWRALQKAFFSDRLPTAEEHPATGWQKFERDYMAGDCGNVFADGGDIDCGCVAKSIAGLD